MSRKGNCWDQAVAVPFFSHGDVLQPHTPPQSSGRHEAKQRSQGFR